MEAAYILEKRFSMPLTRYLKGWELDLTSKKAKERFSDKIDFEKQKHIEKDKRLNIESNIISTVSLCDKCKPSGNWPVYFLQKTKYEKVGSG